MAEVYSWEERLRRSREIRALLTAWEARMIACRALESSARTRAFDPTNLKANIVAQLGSAIALLTGSDVITQLLGELNDNAEAWPCVLEYSWIEGCTGFNIDVVASVTKSTITATGALGTNAFAGFSAGDTVVITGAENVLHNATLVVDASASNVLTFTTNMASTDNTADTSARLTLTRR